MISRLLRLGTSTHRGGHDPNWDTLAPLLRSTSRSFYLSLRFLPEATRFHVALAYGLARAADTIADCDTVAASEREEWLVALQARLTDPGHTRIDAVGQHLRGGNAAERTLLQKLPVLMSLFDAETDRDRGRTAVLLDTLVAGMRLDLAWFGAPGEGVRALATAAELERYCFHVAGVVGGYWTDIHADHLPAVAPHAATLRPLGVRYGHALQLVNVLRDLPADLRRGRCYLPADLLASAGLTPDALRTGAPQPQLMPLWHRLLDDALTDFARGLEFVTGLPKREARLRWCSLLPLVFGVATIGLLRRLANPLDASTVRKVGRAEIYRLMAQAGVDLASNRLLVAWYRALEAEAR
jgi:farnesyl-diphosphate farnesyltransferase